MKHLLLMNPHRRRRSKARKISRRTHRRSRSRITVMKHRRRTHRRRTHHRRHTVRRRAFRGVLMNPHRRRHSRRMRHRRRTRRNTGMALMRLGRMNPARRSRRVRHHRRRGSRGFSLGSVQSTFKSLLDKDTLMIAGGAVASGFMTGYVLQKFGGAQSGFSLPGSSNKYGLIAYQVLIPTGAALLVRRYSPNLAKGFLLGGVIGALQSIIAIAMPVPSSVSSGTTTGTTAYLGTRGVAAYLNPRGVSDNPPGYSAVNAFGASVFASSPAFADDAWSL